MSLKGQAQSTIKLRGSLSMPDAIVGKSAYEIAVMHGFKGTEEEWVASLKGEKGDNGGYYVPYYHEATGELMFSPTRSDMEFVGSVGVIRGERGATGEKGEKGEKGDKGDPGTGSGLPEVTEADNGKINMVVGGQWELVDFPAGEQSEFWVVTALSNSWTESTDEENNPIYENWVYDIEKSMENCKIYVALHAESTATQIAEARRCGVYTKSTDMSKIRFVTSYDTAPTCDLKFKVEITRPNTLSYSVDDASMTLTIVEGYNDGQEQE